jgi:2-polyprenyl-6-methoxyphenol hydroxylase-like FAD-dependent oxidoreductase
MAATATRQAGKERNPMDTPVIIAGAGPGGLALALALHQRCIPAQVYEAVPEIRPLGVGINLLPHSVRVLHALGLSPELEAIGIPTAELRYYNKHGQLIWAEPRGLAAGYDFPQYSIHRGQLQQLLFEAARARLGAASLHLDRALEGWEDRSGAVEVRFRSRAGTAHQARGACLVAADGIHSAARRRLWPGEGPPLFAGRILWRGVSEGGPFLGGRTMIMAGHERQKFVCYPISRAHEQRGAALLNWVAELSLPAGALPPQDWNRQAPKERFAGQFAGWRFDWLDVPAVIERAAAVYEYPLVDRDPLARWSHGRVTLLGDAAHPMYPIGSNGASQAILDAACLAEQLAAEPDIPTALASYDAIRRPATSQIVLMNRANGPEQVMQLAEERAPVGFDDIHSVIPREELEAIAARYKQAAGFTLQAVNRRD